MDRWLKGEKQPSPGGYDPTEINPFMFHGKSYENIQELIESMGQNWNEGKRVLFHGTLGAHVKATNLDLYENCNEAVRKAASKSGTDDIQPLCHLVLSEHCCQKVQHTRQET